MINFSVNQTFGRRIPEKKWQTWLAEIKTGLNKELKTPVEISIAVVSDREIKKLNRIYRHKDKTTDVLSFGEIDQKIKINQSDSGYIGEIIIGYPQAVRQAKEYGHSVQKELKLLLIHGFLHLLGYDHKTASQIKKMRRLEEKILVDR